MPAAGAGPCLRQVLPVRLGQPGAAEQGHLRQKGPTSSATATHGRQAGDYKRAAGSFPAPALHAIWVLNSPRGVKRPGSPIPRGVGMGDPGVLAPRESRAMLQAWGFVVPIPRPPAQL